jgi:lipid-A-disaccharide synthase
VKTLNVMIVCGEPSGDALGAQLIAGLNQLAPGRVRFSGVGGLAMAR